MPGALVTATSANGGVKSTPCTADGSYVLSGLAPGDYSIEAASPGFVQARPATATIAGNQITLNLVLHIRGEAQQVTVTESSAPMVSIDPSIRARFGAGAWAAMLSIPSPTMPTISLTDLQNGQRPAAGLNGGADFHRRIHRQPMARCPTKTRSGKIRINPESVLRPEFDTLGTGNIQILTKPGTDKFRGSAYFGDGGDAHLEFAQPLRRRESDVQPPGRWREAWRSPQAKHGSFSLDLDKRNISNGEVIIAQSRAESVHADRGSVRAPHVAVSPLSPLAPSARASRLSTELEKHADRPV